MVLAIGAHPSTSPSNGRPYWLGTGSFRHNPRTEGMKIGFRRPESGVNDGGFRADGVPLKSPGYAAHVQIGPGRGGGLHIGIFERLAQAAAAGAGAVAMRNLIVALMNPAAVGTLSEQGDPVGRRQQDFIAAVAVQVALSGQAVVVAVAGVARVR